MSFSAGDDDDFVHELYDPANFPPQSPPTLRPRPLPTSYPEPIAGPSGTSHSPELGSEEAPIDIDEGVFDAWNNIPTPPHSPLQQPLVSPSVSKVLRDANPNPYADF